MYHAVFNRFSKDYFCYIGNVASKYRHSNYIAIYSFVDIISIALLYEYDDMNIEYALGAQYNGGSVLRVE